MLRRMFFGIGASSLLLCSVAISCLPAGAQTTKQYTNEDYAAAEKFMAYNVNPLAYKGVVKANWLDDDRFWYRDADETGWSFVVADPAKGTRGAMFDASKLAAALHDASGGAIKDDARHLMLSDLALSDRDSVITFTDEGGSYRCEVAESVASCKRLNADNAAAGGRGHGEKQPPLTLSPDKKLGAFIRNWNLWVRDTATGTETQLTTDGVKDFGYATDNAGGFTPTPQSCFGRPTQKRLPRFSKTSARPAKCTWCR